MSDLIVGKTTTGQRLPILVDGNGKIILSGAFNSVGNVETSLAVISGNVSTIAADLASPLQMKVPGFQLPSYDYLSMAYDGSGNVTSVVYRTGGSTGTIVATLTLGYSGANLVSVTKS